MPLTANRHPDFGGSIFSDPADWQINSYCPDPLAGLEPVAETSNPYRDASLNCMKVLLAVDLFMDSSPDPRLAWYTIALFLRLYPLPRDMSVRELAKALGVSDADMRRSVSRFREIAGLDSAEGRHLVRIASRASAGP
jgi:hypothetical protein